MPAHCPAPRHKASLPPGHAPRGLAVEAGQRRLGEDHLGKQIMDEAGLAGVQAGQQAAGQTELLANAEGHRIEPARQLRCTYEIEPRSWLARW